MAKQKTHSQVTIGFVSLGCPKATVDSEKMLAEIANAGFLITSQPEDADVIVINTCGFIEPAKQEAFEEIKRAAALKKSANVKKVIAVGCLCERMGKDLLNQADGLDATAGLSRRNEIANIIEKTLNSKTPLDFPGDKTGQVSDDKDRLLIGPPHSAYLRISEGCDHRCSFCTIPAIRGRFRSKPQADIIAEAEQLAGAGVVELNLIGQDTTCYGRDIKMKHGLNGLLRQLESVKSIKWIRLMYAYPAGVNKQLIDTIAEMEKIVHYIDMPIQHINDRILKAMRRPDSREQISNLIEKLRRRIEGLVLRTTVIVGFPGETDGQFEELLDFVKWAQFDALGCFKYWAEPGTAAFEMAEQVPEETKQQRLQQLMLTQQGIAFSKNSRRKGTRLDCLVDSVDGKRTANGRFYGQAVDIDGICIIKNCTAAPGSFVSVKVVGMRDYDLLAEPV